MKQKTDYRILDWELISKGQLINASTANMNDDNKGIIFEDLIEILLMAMYPRETWRRTAKSHDGKRDFVFPKDEYLPEQKWAECKNYTSNVSLNIIAPTLIMGALERIRTILFFSYSPLNENAIEGILRYSEFTNQNVKVFDGQLLERLICKHYSYPGISVFFPNNTFNQTSLIYKDKPLRIIKTLRDLSGTRLSPSHVFKLGELFAIHIVVQNLSLESINYNIVVTVDKQNALYFSTPERQYTLSEAEICEYSFRCRALKAGRVTYTVKITIKKPGIGNCIIKGHINIIDEPHLFWTGEQALKAHSAALSHLEAYQTSPLMIVAESGTGKSTLIDIILQEQSILEKYSVLKFDLQQSRSNCLRNVLSQAVGLRGTDSTPNEQIKEDQQTLSFLINAYAESAETISETMLRLYNPQRPYLIVIDDIQTIGRAYISLINELDSKAESMKCSIYYLFTLNESVTSKEDILARLGWDASYQNRICKIISLNKFSKKDILAFMKHKYGLTDIDKYFIDYNNLILPVELHNFCTYLKQRNIISSLSVSPNYRKIYQIVDEISFSQAINTILYANESLNSVWKQLMHDEDALFVLKYLYIADIIGPAFHRKYRRPIDNLISMGILKEADTQIIFCHNEIRKYIKDNLNYSEDDYIDIYTDRNIDDTSKAICALNNTNRIRGAIIFLNSYFQKDTEIARTTQLEELFYYIFENMDQIYEVGLTSSALHFVRYHFTAFNQEHGYNTVFRFLKLVANAALSGLWDTNAESVENMAFFIKKYFDRALNLRESQACLDYYTKFICVFQKLTSVSLQRRNYWLCRYANRLAIICDRESAPTEAEPLLATNYYKQSVEYCNKAGNPADLLLQICVDNFNRHYVYRHNLTAVHIVQTYSELTNIEQSCTLSTSLLSFHLLLLEYLNNKLVNNKKLPDDFLSRLRSTREHTDSAFFKFKMYMLESYILIEQHFFPAADQLLTQAIELAYKNEMRQHIYKITYIKAHLQIFQDGGNISVTSYKLLVLALEQLLNTRGEFINELKREIFIVVRLATIIHKVNPEIIETLTKNKSKEVQSLFQEINAIDDLLQHNSLLAMRSYYIYRDISFPLI